VRYVPDRNAIEIELTDGAGVRLPRVTVEEFRDAPPVGMVLWPAGLEFPIRPVAIVCSSRRPGR
jgi:hypothetical protein